MAKSVRYFVLFTALAGMLVSPALAQSKSSRAKQEQPGSSGSKVDRSGGGQAAPERSNRAQARRGNKSADRNAAGAERPGDAPTKRRR